MPITLILAAIGFFGRHHIYPWIDHPLPWKAAWLNVPRLVITDLGILVVLTILTGMFLRASYRPALHGTAEARPASRSR